MARIAQLEKTVKSQILMISKMAKVIKDLALAHFFRSSRAGTSCSPHEPEVDFSLAAFGKDLPDDAVVGEVSSYQPFPDPYTVPQNFKGHFGAPYADIGHTVETKPFSHTRGQKRAHQTSSGSI